MNTAQKLHGLYLVTPDWDDTRKLLEATELALKGGIALLQYRHKTADAAQRQEQAECLQALCRSYQVPFIINDHVELCMSLDADGIHVGGTDKSVADVRALIGPDKILGSSCYGDLQLALSAQAAGASYVAFGGFYPSKVKKYPVTTPPTIVSDWKAQGKVPSVVIGGMTKENSAPLVKNGADMVAAISSIYLAGDPQRAVQEFNALFA
ncbi:MAG TPA: thiamine phosphate synthase [Oxalicibacterium sp.]|uniref:thiamine phosphate synthase n=1 Tax=Oxalicibacterium sp. TaxID=2766525 RepID=UPI002C5A88F7|nr:thiamine phosphate synthase [Oxalicibacterium sp.]HWU98522.1 thiamine phosphate synthase [Oxalicibacterium sp.]